MCFERIHPISDGVFHLFKDILVSKPVIAMLIADVPKQI